MPACQQWKNPDLSFAASVLNLVNCYCSVFSGRHENRLLDFDVPKVVSVLWEWRYRELLQMHESSGENYIVEIIRSKQVYVSANRDFFVELRKADVSVARRIQRCYEQPIDRKSVV